MRDCNPPRAARMQAPNTPLLQCKVAVQHDRRMLCSRARRGYLENRAGLSWMCSSVSRLYTTSYRGFLTS